MNKNELLKRLETLKECPSTLEDLIADIKKDIILESKSGSAKQRLKTCLSLCEKLASHCRVQLAVAHFKDNIQYFTDSYFAVALKGDDIIEDLPRVDRDYHFKKLDYKANTTTVPDIARKVVDNASNHYKVCANDLLGLTKVEEFINLKLEDDIVSIGSDELKLLLNFLNINNNDTLNIGIVSPLRPVAVSKEDSESLGVICPLRVELTEEAKVYTLKDTRLI